MSKRNEYMDKYILDSFQYDYYEDINLHDMNVPALCKIILEEYDRQGMNTEVNKRRFPNYQQRVEDFMRGLPAPFSPEYRNYYIRKSLEDWEIIKPYHSEGQIEHMVGDGWWQHWANYIIRQARSAK